MGESYFWKPFAQGVATPIVLIGGTNLLLKDFKVSNPYLYWGGLAASSAIVVGILADKIKVPILNAETFEADAESFSAPSHCASCGWNLVQVPIGTETKWGVAIEGNQYYYNHNACKGIGKLPIKAESFNTEDDGWVKNGYSSFLRKKQFHFEKEFTMPPYPNTLKIDVDGYFTGISYEDEDESYFNTPKFIKERKEFVKTYTDSKLQEILEKYTMSKVKSYYEEIADDWLFGEREEEEIEEEDMSDWGLTDEEIAKYKQEMAEEKAEEKAQEMADLEEEINSHIEYCEFYFKEQMNRYMSDWSYSWMGEETNGQGQFMGHILPTFLPTHIKFVDETRGITIYEYNQGGDILSYDAENFKENTSYYRLSQVGKMPNYRKNKTKTHPYVIDGKRRLKTWKENAREIKKEYDDEDWRDADKQIDYLKGIHEYLEDCTDEEFEDWFINIDQPDMSQFAFDYKNVFGNATDREERMNYFEGYINMLREGQQNMFPDSFYDAESYEDSWEKGVIRLAISSGCFSDEYAEWVERQIDGPNATLNNPRYKKIVDKRWGLSAETFEAEDFSHVKNYDDYRNEFNRIKKEFGDDGEFMRFKIDQLHEYCSRKGMMAETFEAETTMTVEHKDGSKYRYSETDPIYGEMGGIVGHVSEIKDEKDTPYQKIYGRDVTRGHNFHLNHAETFNSDSHTDSFMADMPVNAVKNNDGEWYIPSVHRNDYKETFKNWKPSKYPYEKKITQDSVNEACNSCGKENVHYQFYLARKNSVNPKIRFLDNATYCQYDTNTCGGNICGDCAENASCENCGAEICTFCEEENNYDHSDLVCVDCREFNESLEDD